MQEIVKEKEIKGLLFDLDGVIVDTAKYHYLAWKKLADDMGIPFTTGDNERLKGVSRKRSLEIILEIGNLSLSEEEKEKNCEKKNALYLTYIKQLTEEEVLPGVRKFLTEARAKGYKIALGSASRNAVLILNRLGIKELFDEIIDGNAVSKVKPDPEVFIMGAKSLKVPYDNCIVFEDAAAGIEAAHNAGMFAVGIGSSENLPQADLLLPGLNNITIEEISKRLQEVRK